MIFLSSHQVCLPEGIPVQSGKGSSSEPEYSPVSSTLQPAHTEPTPRSDPAGTTFLSAPHPAPHTHEDDSQAAAKPQVVIATKFTAREKPNTEGEEVHEEPKLKSNSLKLVTWRDLRSPSGMKNPEEPPHPTDQPELHQYNSVTKMGFKSSNPEIQSPQSPAEKNTNISDELHFDPTSLVSVFTTESAPAASRETLSSEGGEKVEGIQRPPSWFPVVTNLNVSGVEEDTPQKWEGSPKAPPTNLTASSPTQENMDASGDSEIESGNALPSDSKETEETEESFSPAANVMLLPDEEEESGAKRDEEEAGVKMEQGWDGQTVKDKVVHGNEFSNQSLSILNPNKADSMVKTERDPSGGINPTVTNTQDARPEPGVRGQRVRLYHQH